MVRGSKTTSWRSHPVRIHHFFDPVTGKGLSVEAPAWTTLLPDLVLQFFPNFNSSTVGVARLGAGRDRREPVLPAGAQRIHGGPLHDACEGSSAMRPVRGHSRSVGRLIHHVQDMAQPQHVRNDAHLHVELLEQYCPNWVPLLLSGPECAFYRSFKAPSIYEQWTKGLPESSLPMTGYGAGVWSRGSDDVRLPAPVLDPRWQGLGGFHEPQLPQCRNDEPDAADGGHRL